MRHASIGSQFLQTTRFFGARRRDMLSQPGWFYGEGRKSNLQRNDWWELFLTFSILLQIYVLRFYAHTVLIRTYFT